MSYYDVPKATNLIGAVCLYRYIMKYRKEQSRLTLYHDIIIIIMTLQEE